MNIPTVPRSCIPSFVGVAEVNKLSIDSLLWAKKLQAIINRISNRNQNKLVFCGSYAREYVLKIEGAVSKVFRLNHNSGVELRALEYSSDNPSISIIAGLDTVPEHIKVMHDELGKCYESIIECIEIIKKSNIPDNVSWANWELDFNRLIISPVSARPVDPEELISDSYNYK